MSARYLYCCWESERDGFDPHDHVIGVAQLHSEPFEVDGIHYHYDGNTVLHIRPMIQLLGT